jgi:hypothetical protein
MDSSVVFLVHDGERVIKVSADEFSHSSNGLAFRRDGKLVAMFFNPKWFMRNDAVVK